MAFVTFEWLYHQIFPSSSPLYLIWGNAGQSVFKGNGLAKIKIVKAIDNCFLKIGMLIKKSKLPLKMPTVYLVSVLSRSQIKHDYIHHRASFCMSIKEKTLHILSFLLRD